MGAAEELTVAAEAPIVDVTSKEVGGNITSRELTDCPVNRNFIGFIGLLPGVVPNISTESFGSDSVSVNGQDARNNNYLLDGANNNDDVIGQRAGTQARTPIEAIQEFQVLTSQFDAEFGRTTGAIVNAVTKQGENEFHGSAFAFIQDAALTREDYFVEQNNLAKPDTELQQYGFTLGGPIVKNKAHFFVSVERVDRRGHDINIPARPELNAPATEDRVWNTLVRFDHQINANHTWNVRWLREASPQLNQVINGAQPVTLAATREEDDLDQTVAARSTPCSATRASTRCACRFTQEDVLFANPAFNANRHQAQLPPTLQYLTFVDQQDNDGAGARQRRLAGRGHVLLVHPGEGRPQPAHGHPVPVLRTVFSTQDHLNGTFSFRSNSLRCGRLPHLPGAAADPRPRRERVHAVGHFFGVRPGQVEAQPPADREPRRALRPGEEPDPSPHELENDRSRAPASPIPTTTRSTRTTSRRAWASPTT